MKHLFKRADLNMTLAKIINFGNWYCFGVSSGEEVNQLSSNSNVIINFQGVSKTKDVVQLAFCDN